MTDWAKSLRLSYRQAMNSPDPSTQNGAILTDGSTSYVGDCNRFPRGVQYTDDRWERPLKYKIVEHAERNVIFRAARQGIVTEGLTLVCGWAACSDCARAIIQAGIVRLVRHQLATDRSPDFWLEEIEVADQLLKEAGIEVVDYPDPVECGFQLRHSGELWSP